MSETQYPAEIQDLIDRADQADKNSIVAAYKGKATAEKSYFSDPCDETAKFQKAARAIYYETLERLQAKYPAQKSSTPSTPSTVTRPDGLVYPANVPEDMAKVLAVADMADARDLLSRFKARDVANASASKQPTAANIRAQDMAGKSFAECLGRLVRQYLAPSDEPVSVPNRLEAVAWLNAQGYAIGKSKLYADSRKKKLLPIQDDGSVLVADLKKYINKIGLVRLSGETAPDQKLEKLYEDKLRLEVQKLEWENKKREFEYERELGKWIPREDLELELAARAAVLDSGLRTRLKVLARDMVLDLGGSPDRVPDLVGKIHQVLDGLMNEFASLRRFEVIFEPAEEIHVPE